MTDPQTSTLVFKDQAGSSYLVPRDTLEQGRVPAERTAAVERLIAEAAATQSSERGDVEGYFLPLIFGGIVILSAEIAVMIGWGGDDLHPNGTITPRVGASGGQRSTRDNVGNRI